MFNLFRSQKQMVRLFLGGLLTMVAFSMVVTLIPGLFSNPADPTDLIIAEVDGREITSTNLAERLRLMGVRPDLPLRTLNLTSAQYTQDLIADQVLLNEAEALGLLPDEQELAEWLKFQLPFLFPDGVFVGQLAYTRYVQEAYRRSVPEFEAELALDLAINTRLRRLVTANEWVSNEDLQQAYRDRHSKAKIEFVKVTVAGVRDRVPVSEEKLKEFYEQRKPTYLIDENRTAKLLTVSDALLPPPEVAEADMRRHYNQNLVIYENPERVQARHILFMTLDKSEEESAAIEVKAKKVLEEVRAGGDFVKLAAQHSEDPASASDGGDLGWVTRGQMDPEFETGTFALKVGEISELVKSTFGFHIIKADAREDGGTKPFEEVQEQVREALRRERLHLSRIKLLDEVMAAARGEGADLDEVGRRFSLPVRTVGPFTLAEPAPELATPQEFLNQVFTAEVGEPLSSTKEGQVTIVVLTEINRPRQAEFEDVRDQVRGQFLDAEGTALASERAYEIAEEARNEGAILRRVAARYGLKTEVSPFFKTIEPVLNLGPARLLGPAPFKSEPGTLLGPVPVEGDFVVYKVVAHEEADLLAFEDEKESIRKTQLDQKRNQGFEVYKAAMVDRYMQEKRVARYDQRVAEFALGFSRRGG